MPGNRSEYDVIIAGAGMAGLSLLWQIRQSGLNDLTVLLLDQNIKSTNDRTWSFWEKTPGPLDHLVFRSWNEVRVTNSEGQELFMPLGEYHYKTIRGIDLYRFMDQQIASDPRTTRSVERMVNVVSVDDGINVQTDVGTYRGRTLFDSTYQLPLSDPNATHLLQHFLGYVIKSPKPIFNPERPDLMNFQVPHSGDCRFIYILPFSETEALVEYTLFTEKVLEESEYINVLTEWISKELGLNEYEILEQEFGVIPMSDEPVEEFPLPHVIRIGTAGGYTNPATGYTFKTTQKRVTQLVEHYKQTGNWRMKSRLREPRFDFYSSVLLDVLANRRELAAKLFWDLYRKNPIERVFRFLDGESTLIDDVQVMHSSPKIPFTRAGWGVLWRGMNR